MKFLMRLPCAGDHSRGWSPTFARMVATIHAIARQQQQKRFDINKTKTTDNLLKVTTLAFHLCTLANLTGQPRATWVDLAYQQHIRQLHLTRTTGQPIWQELFLNNIAQTHMNRRNKRSVELRLTLAGRP